MLCGGSVLAAPGDTGPAPSVRVSYADLNLNAAAGRATLDRRIQHAIHQVCPEPGTDAPERIAEMMACRTTVRQTVAVQVAQAIEGGQATRLALATAQRGRQRPE